MSILVLSDENFDQEVAAAKLPMLVDFWAPWCGPCKALGPVLEEVAAELEGRLAVAKMNVDENQATPARFDVRSIPNLVIIKNGALAGRLVGSRPKAKLLEELAPFMENRE